MEKKKHFAGGGSVFYGLSNYGELMYVISQAIYGMKIIPVLLKAIEEIEPDCIIYDFMCTMGKQMAQITKIPAVAFFPCFYSGMQEMKVDHKPLDNKQSQRGSELFELFIVVTEN